MATALEAATAVVGMQVLASVSDEAIAAANGVISFLEQWPGTLAQVETDGDALVLRKPG